MITLVTLVYVPVASPTDGVAQELFGMDCSLIFPLFLNRCYHNLQVTAAIIPRTHSFVHGRPRRISCLSVFSSVRLVSGITMQRQSSSDRFGTVLRAHSFPLNGWSQKIARGKMKIKDLRDGLAASHPNCFGDPELSQTPRRTTIAVRWLHPSDSLAKE